IVKRVRMGRPGLVGSSGRQQSEPAGETEERFHALMLCADAEKSSLGFNTLCGENLAVHSAQTPGVCGIFPLREPGGVRPNFYPLEIRARRSLAPLFMVPMRDSGIVEATHASVGMSCIFVSLTPASPLGRGRIVRCLSAVPGVAYPRDSSLMLANLLQARRRVDGRRQRDCRRLWPFPPGGKRFPFAAAVDLRCRLPIDAAVRYPLQNFAAVNRAIHFLVGADDAILPRLVKLALWFSGRLLNALGRLRLGFR